MGFNTTLFVLNDGFDQIEKNPDEFVEKISREMHDGGGFGVGNHGNCTQVMRTQHADIFRLYGTHQNLMLELTPWDKDTVDLAERDDIGRRVVLDFIASAETQLQALRRKVENL